MQHACESAMNEIAVSQRCNSESAVSETAVSEDTMSEIAVSACSGCDRSECCHAVLSCCAVTFPIDYGAATTCHNLPQLTTTCCGEMWWVVVSCGKPATTYHKNGHIDVVSCGNHNSPQLEPTTCHNSPQSIHILPQLNHTLPQLNHTLPHLTTIHS